MTRWALLSYVPGTSAHATYAGTLKYLAEAAAFLEREYPEKGAFPTMPIPRDPGACRFAIETTMAAINAIAGIERGLDLPDLLALFAEHAPVVG